MQEPAYLERGRHKGFLKCLYTEFPVYIYTQRELRARLY